MRRSQTWHFMLGSMLFLLCFALASCVNQTTTPAVSGDTESISHKDELLKATMYEEASGASKQPSIGPRPYEGHFLLGNSLPQAQRTTRQRFQRLSNRTQYVAHVPIWRLYHRAITRQRASSSKL